MTSRDMILLRLDLEEVHAALRVNRIKLGTDYTITVKYGLINVMCAEVFADTIKEVFLAKELVITKLFTY